MSEAINSTSGTVRYILKDIKAKKETSIILDYSFGRGNRIKFSTGYKVLPKHWDKSKQRVRAISTIQNREKINSDLEKFSSDFINGISKLESSQKANKKVLKNLLIKIIRKEEGTEIKSIKTFFDFADDFIKRKEYQAKNLHSVKLSLITVRSYKQTVNRIKEFNRVINYNVDFENINLKFYYQFVAYLEENEYSINTIGKHIKNLITILNKATEEGLNKNLKYKHSEFKVVSEETNSIYLTEKEIENLYNIDLSKNKRVELARDIFLIGYYTGQRVSDYNGIRKDQIKTFNGKEVFEFIQKKTGNKIYVPVHPKIKEIMNLRYDGGLPPTLNNPDINENIKKAGELAEIDELITIKKIKGGKEIIEKEYKFNLIVSHTARRSFCSNAYLSKMPVIDIMAISGHKTEREFYKYIKITPKERAVKISESAFFKN